MSNWRRKLISHTLPWLLLAVAMLLVLTQVRRPEMLAAVWVPWAEVGVLAIIMTAIILTGGIDLSIGSMVALCAMVQAPRGRDPRTLYLQSGISPTPPDGDLHEVGKYELAACFHVITLIKVL